MAYEAIRTARWKLIHYTERAGCDELYDLESDPHEMRNRIDDAATTEEVASLRRRLAVLVKQAGHE